MNLGFLLIGVFVVGFLAPCANVLGQDGTSFQQAKLISVPVVSAPKESKETGLGGKVSFQVAVNEFGDVTAIEDVRGPGPVCKAVTRPDVVALRQVAEAGAMKAKFLPALRKGTPEKSSLWISFDFPGDPNKKELHYNAANREPQNYQVVPSGSTYAITQDGNLPSPNSLPKTISGGILEGRATRLPAPPYPPAARAVRASGTVGIQVLIDENGDIFSAEPVSGHPLLRSASVIAACKAKFPPTLLSGQPGKVSGIITYNFVP